MMKKRYATPLPVFLLGMLFAFTCHAQEKEAELLIYKSPSSDFHDIVIQHHEGLPRFGAYDMYSKPQNSKGKKNIHSRPKLSLDEKEKLRKVSVGYQNYGNMLQLKFLTKDIDQLDKEKPVAAKTNYSEAEKDMMATYRKLTKITQGLCASDDCKNSFSYQDEFEQKRKYKNFMNKILPSLLSWNQDFLKNNEISGYLVSRLNLRDYDFDKNGYWVYYNMKPELFHRTAQTIFKPKKTFEHDLANKSKEKNLQFFVAVSPETAEKLQEQSGNVYMAQKIHISFEKQETPINTVVASFNFENPTVNLYSDSGLEEKLTTVSIDKAVFKTP